MQILSWAAVGESCTYWCRTHACQVLQDVALGFGCTAIREHQCKLASHKLTHLKHISGAHGTGRRLVLLQCKSHSAALSGVLTQAACIRSLMIRLHPAAAIRHSITSC